MKLVPMPEHVDGTEGVGKYLTSLKRRHVNHSKALRISTGNVARIIVKPLGCFESMHLQVFEYISQLETSCKQLFLLN